MLCKEKLQPFLTPQGSMQILTNQRYFINHLREAKTIGFLPNCYFCLSFIFKFYNTYINIICQDKKLFM
jgi:hypothetical protein